MPKLWNETIETHRHDVREAILDATMALVAEHGPLSVTMSQIAEKTGIGRATLYKYFVDVESILVAWHDRQVAHHLEQLAELRRQPGDAWSRLQAVLEAFALMRHGHHDPDLAALVHRGEHIGQAHRQLTDLVAGLLTQAAAAGQVRDDVTPSELAVYCIHAISAAASLPSKAAVLRLVQVTLAGVCPDRPPRGGGVRKRRRRGPA
jgi:AcrR family transcriptional regulator